MYANVRSFKFVVRKGFGCVNNVDSGDKFVMPSGYVFTAWVRTYQRNGGEYQDFVLFPDGDLVKSRMEIRGVSCDHTSFVEDE